MHDARSEADGPWREVPLPVSPFGGSYSFAEEVAATLSGFVAVGRAVEDSGVVRAGVWISPDGLVRARASMHPALTAPPDDAYEAYGVATSGRKIVVVGKHRFGAMPDEGDGAIWFSPDEDASWRLLPSPPCVLPFVRPE